MSTTKRLNVKRTNLKEIEERWGFKPLALNPFEELYVRCNSKGLVNWDKAPIYKAKELITKNNVKIL